MIKYYPTYESEDRTDFSFADRYLEERRTGQLVRIKIKYPLVEGDRKIGNIDYSDELYKRQFRGTTPKYSYNWSELSSLSYAQMKQGIDLSLGRYKFRSDVVDGSHIPQGYVATESGIEPITYEPFTNGDPVGNTVIINGEFNNTLVSGAGMLVGKNINTENMHGERYPYIAETNCGRFNWQIKKEFNNPTEPEVRLPNGAIRKSFFKY
jgi:hypothetical protein